MKQSKLFNAKHIFVISTNEEIVLQTDEKKMQKMWKMQNK